MPTLTEYENTVLDFARKNAEIRSMRYVKKLAAQMHRRQVPLDDAHMSRILGIYQDPTPRAAFRDISDNDRAAALRLGLIGAGA